MLEFKNISVSYGRKEILRDVSFRLAKGTFLSLLGPNGSGKSTLVKAAANLLPAKGIRLLDGRPYAGYSRNAFARTCAYLPQMLSGGNDLTVRELIACGRYPVQNHIFGKLSSGDKDAIDSVLEKTGIRQLSRRRVGTLSGGERQKAFLAMTLVRNPALLILDEPTSFLDIRSKLELLELLSRLKEEFSLTVLAVLHDLTQAEQYSDSILLLHGGKAAAQGLPAEVLTPENLQTVFGVRSEKRETMVPVI